MRGRGGGGGVIPTKLCLIPKTSFFPGGSVVKNPPADTADSDLIPGSGRSPGEGNGYPLWYSCLENCMDRGDWQAIVHRIVKSWT